FLDEPTSALDPAGRYDILELISSLRGQVTVFLSSHILADVERVCDTIGIIHKGKLLLVKPRDTLLAEHATNVIALELDRGCLPQLNGFLAHLEAQPWAANVTQTDNTVRIAVTDTAVSKQALLPILVEHGLVLNRYEWIRPSLEEIFLSLSE
ncbi:MAG: DUF4162 domain-containing protein, partial [Anaerolineales bacterium]|nr:DUF4162 domain-containing protein [Anaerolineales bacterium]